MMIIIAALIFSQSFLEFENKQIFYPEPARAESTHAYDVLHYLIDLDLPMTSRYLAGAVTIAMRSEEDNLNNVELQLLGFNVDSVRVNGISASYSHVDETLRVNLPAVQNSGDSFSVMIGYSGTASGTMGYLWWGGSNPIAYTLGCAFAEKRWLPCFDRLWDKADYGCEYLITVPDTFTVCAIGEYLGKTVNSGYATYHWKHGFPVSPYLMHFASSKFVTYSDWYHPASGDSIELKYFFWKQDTTAAHNAFSLMTDMMFFYDSLFGAYPFERYGMDIVNPFFYGGMEHQTMATILRTWIQGTPNYYGLAHELSHMWWGDMVTCFGWANVWLNEGFGTYCDALYREYREGHASFITTMISRRQAYINEENNNPFPLYDPPVSQIFSWGHSYCKGSWVLHMIRFLCGNDNTWQSLMAAYRDSFAYANASTDDLNRIMNQVLAGDFDWFFQEWVYDMGYPKYDLRWGKVYEAPNWRLLLDIDQTQTIGPQVFHMPLPIGVDFAADDTILVLPITQAPEHFEFLFAQEPESVVIDPETWVIHQSVVTGISESGQNTGAILARRFQTISHSIMMEFTEPVDIKIFDITGRMVFEKVTSKINYFPRTAGIYQVWAGDKKYRFVVLR